MLFDEGQGSGQVLLESSQVQLRLLVVRLEGGGEREGGGGREEVNIIKHIVSQASRSAR